MYRSGPIGTTPFVPVAQPVMANVKTSAVVRRAIAFMGLRAVAVDRPNRTSRHGKLGTFRGWFLCRLTLLCWKPLPNNDYV